MLSNALKEPYLFVGTLNVNKNSVYIKDYLKHFMAVVSSGFLNITICDRCTQYHNNKIQLYD